MVCDPLPRPLTDREWTDFTPMAREGEPSAPRLGHWVRVTDEDPHARGEHSMKRY